MEEENGKALGTDGGEFVGKAAGWLVQKVHPAGLTIGKKRTSPGIPGRGKEFRTRILSPSGFRGPSAHWIFPEVFSTRRKKETRNLREATISQRPWIPNKMAEEGDTSTRVETRERRSLRIFARRQRWRGAEDSTNRKSAALGLRGFYRVKEESARFDMGKHNLNKKTGKAFRKGHSRNKGRSARDIFHTRHQY